ncbi:MAG: hypothetical protein JSW27_10790 [Phycisphaerales bacterium]|nr:MAG: hypothetical protein JSW27_10790 [Phycisphaerales bacterium]
MPKEKKLTRRQRAVIEDLFMAEMDEQDVLDKHKVSRALYSRWLADERFIAYLEWKMAQAYRSGRLILARYATVAAGKLVALTDCEKEETARKACLDIITLDNPTLTASPNAASDQSDTGPAELPPETARRILAALAQQEPK